MTTTSNPLNDLVPGLADALATAPMPPYSGIEPSEIEIERIRKYVGEGRFNELPEDLQDWVCSRLMPSLARYGTYPPPHEVQNSTREGF